MAQETPQTIKDNEITITFSDYEYSRLKEVLLFIKSGWGLPNLNTGDWLHQILFKMTMEFKDYPAHVENLDVEDLEKQSKGYRRLISMFNHLYPEHYRKLFNGEEFDENELNKEPVVQLQLKHEKELLDVILRLNKIDQELIKKADPEDMSIGLTIEKLATLIDDLKGRVSPEAIKEFNKERIENPEKLKWLKLVVEFESFDLNKENSGEEEPRTDWVASIPQMPGMMESGPTKEEAFYQLMVSLMVKVAYDNKVELHYPSEPGILLKYMNDRIIYLRKTENEAIKELDKLAVGTFERAMKWELIRILTERRRELEDIILYMNVKRLDVFKHIDNRMERQKNNPK